ncbi:sigma-70 family RNA polymerase sigma factor [bacterium SCSIO 12741]|nr:sigma-70 family RNA polymerase sigma factor [bacterium SCSIO 12741]
MIRDHLLLIHKVSWFYTRDPEERKDLAQEIVYQICRSYSSFKGNSKPSTWIYRIGINTAIGQLRQKKMITEPLSQHTHLAQPDEEKREQQKELQQAIQRLDEAEKSLVMLFLDDIPYREIGEILGISENLVGVKIHRIKNKLKKFIHGTA